MKRKNTAVHRKKVKDERNIKFPIRPDEIKLNDKRILFYKSNRPKIIDSNIWSDLSRIKEICKHPKSRKKYKEKINE